ncbi:MAG: glucosaminidase domain-containing protein [Halieaceae bacterium]
MRRNLNREQLLMLVFAPALFLILVFFLSLRLPSRHIPVPTPTPDFGPLPDFTAMADVRSMKAAFFDYLHPIVSFHNDRLLQQRAELLALRSAIAEEKSLSDAEGDWLRELTLHYELDCDASTASVCLDRLLRRADIIPLELTLVQAAKESGWGRSRFAIKANNLFGQWCYKSGCGLVPHLRPEEMKHEIAEFPSIDDAIRRYMLNLNTHERYQLLRQLRADLRAEGKPIDGLALADGLLYYSQRREPYIDELKSMIIQYRDFEATRRGP